MRQSIWLTKDGTYEIELLNGRRAVMQVGCGETTASGQLDAGAGTAASGQLHAGTETACAAITLPYRGAYGLGEKFDAVNQKGKRCVNQVVEKFCEQGALTYCSVPFFFTDSGFGLLARTAEKTVFDFGALRNEPSVSAPEQDGVADGTGKNGDISARTDDGTILTEAPRGTELVLFTGTPREILSSLAELLGPVTPPPDYAFGPWISANGWHCQRDVERVLGELKKYDFPATVLVLEAWSDEATFYIWNGARYTPKADGGAFRYEEFDFTEDGLWPDPKGMVKRLAAEGIATVLWQIPVYKAMEPGAENAQNALDAADAVKRKLCVFVRGASPPAVKASADAAGGQAEALCADTRGMRMALPEQSPAAAGRISSEQLPAEPYRIPPGNWFAGSLIPDFTNPQTRRTWFEKRRYLLEMGVAGFKTDGGEFIYRDDLIFADGSTGREQKNAYCQTYVDAYRDFAGKERLLFSRAGYTGAKRTPILWAGDHRSTNDELQNVFRAAMSAACSGISFWSFDIGGFAGPLPDLDLYRRATQWACFTPVMQWHSEPVGGQFRELLPGAEGNNERSPWNIALSHGAPAFIGELRYWYRLRMALLPYLVREAQASAAAGLPLMRPLLLDCMEDGEAARWEDEYYLGEALLVAPLLEKEQTRRTVYLPHGAWTGLFSGQRYEGGRPVDSAPERFPVYVRAGAALPFAVPYREKSE